MIQTSVDVGVLVTGLAALGASMGAVNQLARWGVETLRSRGTRSSNGGPGGFGSLDRDRIEDTVKIARDTNTRLRELTLAINGQLKQSLREEQQQTATMAHVAEEITRLRIQMAGTGGRKAAE